MPNSLAVQRSAPPPVRRLVLGSTSPYRRMALARLGLAFDVDGPHVDEAPRPGETPADLAHRLAQDKALAVSQRHPDALVIGSDQVADLHGRPLGKPGNHDRATEQLNAMSGQVVVFHTAVSLVCADTGFRAVRTVPVRVGFRELSAAEIERYLRIEQPYDCAGSAKSEGLGISLLRFIDSLDNTALVGLPLIATCDLLRDAGVHLP